MIKQLSKISNVGIFENFNCPTEFQKNNIIFGFNGAGKSTLSDIFYSMSHTNKEDLILRRKTLSRSENDLEKEISISITTDTPNSIEFSKKQWSNTPSNMFVFNNQYIDDYVFVSQTLNGSTIPIGMGKDGVKLMKQREKLQNDINCLIQEMNTSISILSNAGFKFKDVTTSKITTRTNLKRYLTISNFELYSLHDKAIYHEKIKNHTKYSNKLSHIAECKTLYENISGISTINYAIINKKISKIPKITSKEIAAYLSNTLTVTDISWAVNGYYNQKDSTVCPMCGQTISDKNAKQFFNKLGKYVSQNRSSTLDSFCEELRGMAATLYSINIIHKIKVFNDIINILNSDNLLLKRDISRLNKGLSWTIVHSNIIEKIIQKLYKKAANPYQTMELSPIETDCLKLLNQVINNFTILGDIINSSEERLYKKIEHSLSVDEMSLKYDLAFGANRIYMETLISDSKSMLHHMSKLENINSQIDDCFNQIKLKQVNHYLDKLNTNIKIEVSSKKYFIRLKDFSPIPYEKEKNNTIFSEGEQRAIAFAYFLSELNETSSEVSKKIIVIDDPISSMDLCRKSIISYQLSEIMENENNQVFILTHDITFIERIINFIKDGIVYNTYELNVEKNDFLPLNIEDYLTNDEQVYSKLIHHAETNSEEIHKILALISLRPYCYVKKVSATDLNTIYCQSTYFAHTLYSKNNRISFRNNDYLANQLKSYINFVNHCTNSTFDAERIIGNYDFTGFDFQNLVDLYNQIPLNNIDNARKKVLLMRPLIEACFFQLSLKNKFDPEHIGKMYKNTTSSNKNDSLKYDMCQKLTEIYDSSKKYHHGADEGSLLGISWINPGEIEFYDQIIQNIISSIQSIGLVKSAIA